MELTFVILSCKSTRASEQFENFPWNFLYIYCLTNWSLIFPFHPMIVAIWRLWVFWKPVAGLVQNQNFYFHHLFGWFGTFRCERLAEYPFVFLSLLAAALMFISLICILRCNWRHHASAIHFYSCLVAYWIFSLGVSSLYILPTCWFFLLDWVIWKEKKRKEMHLFGWVNRREMGWSEEKLISLKTLILDLSKSGGIGRERNQ